MPTFDLLIKAHMENVTNLEPEDIIAHQWCLKLKCGGCREVSDKFRFVSANDVLDIPNSRGTANYVEKCKFCGKHSTINVILDQSTPYVNTEEFQKIVAFEARGTEPVEFQFSGEWKCQSTLSSAVFNHIDLTDTFADYDENGGEPVTIDEMESKFK